MHNEHPLTELPLPGILFGAAAFQILRAGCELGLFELLRRRPRLADPDIARALGLHDRPAQILLLGTTALGLTTKRAGLFANARVIDALFRNGTWGVFKDIVEFEARIAYPAQADFVESLRANDNIGLRRFDGTGADLYHRLATNPELRELFYRCMRSWSRLANPVLVSKADLGSVRCVLDVGGGEGVNAIALARANPDIRFTVMDLPEVVTLATQNIERERLQDRISVRAGDIFNDPYPADHDCVLFANQLLIWSPEKCFHLLRKAHDRLPQGGRVLIFSAMADDDGDGPLYSALDNVYFATLPAGKSIIYRWCQYEEWLGRIGFSAIRRFPGDTWTPHGVICAVKERS